MANQTPITPGFYAGKDGRVFLGTTAGTPASIELSITKWSGSHSNPMSDRTNSKSGGAQAGTKTTESMNGTASCVVPDDATGDPEFLPGNVYQLTLIAHDARGYAFPAYIESIDPSSETTGDLGYDFSYKSVGPIQPWTATDLTTLPTGVTGQGSAASGTV